MNNIQVVWLKSTHCHFCKEKSLPKQEKVKSAFINIVFLMVIMELTMGAIL